MGIQPYPLTWTPTTNTSNTERLSPRRFQQSVFFDRFEWIGNKYGHDWIVRMFRMKLVIWGVRPIFRHTRIYINIDVYVRPWFSTDAAVQPDRHHNRPRTDLPMISKTWENMAMLDHKPFFSQWLIFFGGWNMAMATATFHSHIGSSLQWKVDEDGREMICQKW